MKLLSIIHYFYKEESRKILLCVVFNAMALQDECDHDFSFLFFIICEWQWFLGKDSRVFFNYLPIQCVHYRKAWSWYIYFFNYFTPSKKGMPLVCRVLFKIIQHIFIFFLMVNILLKIADEIQSMSTCIYKWQLEK